MEREIYRWDQFLIPYIEFTARGLTDVQYPKECKPCSLKPDLTYNGPFANKFNKDAVNEALRKLWRVNQKKKLIRMWYRSVLWTCGDRDLHWEDNDETRCANKNEKAVDVCYKDIFN